MIIVSAKLYTKPGMRADVIAAARVIVAETRKEVGCISYTLYASTESETELMFFELWESQETLDAHMKTPHFALLKDIQDKCLDGDLDIQVFQA